MRTSSNKHRTKARLLTLAAAAAVTAAACGGSESPVEIGFRRVALDLAFKDAEKAPPVEAAQVIRSYIDSDVTFLDEYEEPETRRVVRRVAAPPVRMKRECPTAPEGATPPRDAFAVIKDPPKVGVYPRHNEGTMTVTLGTSPFEVPVPALSRWEIPAVRFVRASTVLNDKDVEALDPPDSVRNDTTAFPEIPEFEITRKLLPGYSTTDTYRYSYDGGTDDYLYLVKRVTVARGVETVFEPTPPIRLVKLNVPEGNIADAGVVHGGIDRDSNVAMAVQSQIVSREYVDVCGEIADTYRVQIKEQFADLSKTPPQTSGNEGDATNYWNIQFDNGLLIVREEVDSTVRTTTQVLGQAVPLVVHYKYTSTLDKIEPDPLSGPREPTTGESTDTPEDEAVEN